MTISRMMFLPLLLGIVVAGILVYPSFANTSALILMPIVFLCFCELRQAIIFRLTFVIIVTFCFIGDLNRYFYFAYPWRSLAYYFLIVAINTLPWLLLRPRQQWALWQKNSFIVFIMLLYLIPPLGIFPVALFLCAAGVLFPGMGWFGFASYILLILVVFSFFQTKFKQKRYAILSVLLILLAVASQLRYVAPTAPKGWVAVNTQLSKKQQLTHYSIAKASAQPLLDAINSGAKVVIMPESAVYLFGKYAKAAWQKPLAAAKHKNASIIFGGESLVNNEIVSGFYIFNQDRLRFVASRQPIPFIHNEFMNLTFSRWFTQTNFELDQQNVQVVVCYESFSPWLSYLPFMQRHKPTVILSLSNLWFSESELTRHYQDMIAEAVSRLFGVPILVARNYHYEKL